MNIKINDTTRIDTSILNMADPDTAIQDTATQDTATQDTATQDTASQDTANQDTAILDAVHRHDGLADEPRNQFPHGEAASDDDSRSWVALGGAVAATVFLLAAFAVVVFGGDDTAEIEPVAAPTTVSTVPEPIVVEPVATVAPVASVPPVAPPSVPTPVAPPVVAPPVAPPPVEPAPPTGTLTAQGNYVLDPGVTGVSVTLWNEGDAPLSYEIVNEGVGFDSLAPIGTIEPGDPAHIWVEINVAPVGDGPTPFEVDVDIVSDGGDATVVVSGQLEKPGHVIAEFESMPFVDYRATVAFTNVGGLPVEIVGFDAPGLRYSMLPDSIAAGETIEVDVAVCEGGEPLPQVVPQPPLMLTTYIASSVTLEVLAAPDADPIVATTSLSATVGPFEPLDCSPVVAVPSLDLTLDLDVDWD